MTEEFDSYFNYIMESVAPEDHTQTVMMKYGNKLRNLKNSLMTGSNLDKKYKSLEIGFRNVADQFIDFYNNRKGEIDNNPKLSQIAEVIFRTIRV